jgi:hypothetical protein
LYELTSKRENTRKEVLNNCIIHQNSENRVFHGEMRAFVNSFSDLAKSKISEGWKISIYFKYLLYLSINLNQIFQEGRKLVCVSMKCLKAGQNVFLMAFLIGG